MCVLLCGSSAQPFVDRFHLFPRIGARRVVVGEAVRVQVAVVVHVAHRRRGSGGTSPHVHCGAIQNTRRYFMSVPSCSKPLS